MSGFARHPDTAGPAATVRLEPVGSSVATRRKLSCGIKLWLACKVAAAGLFAARQPWWAAAVYLLPDPWLLWNIAKPGGTGFGPVASAFATTRREVWITIDDGPDPESTPGVLELLDRYGARATFFLIGQQVERHPELVREIVRRGHGVANHTHTHPCWKLWRYGPRAVGAEIDACNAALAAAGAAPSSYLRVPVGIKTPFVFPALAARGMSLIAWSARGFDAISDAESAARRIVAGVEPGAIVLLHEGRRCRAGLQVVERVLEHLQREKYDAILPSPERLRAGLPRPGRRS